MSPTLLVLAAGMGSRYGGLKQMDPMGPNGETVLDYSVFDAIRAGFKRVVFIIRKDFAEDFKESVGKRFAGKIEVDYVFQDINELPAGFSVPQGREKPWGTGHAVLAARDVVKGHFAVINADDFYGRDSYKRAAEFLGRLSKGVSGEIAMIGYPILNTLSDHGTVNRGICTTNAQNELTSVEEYVNIGREADRKLHGDALDGSRRTISPDAPVSMNFWVFGPDFFPQLEESFINFLKNHGAELKSEFFIPTVVDELISSGKVRCFVLETDSQWFGVTYPTDKPVVVESIQKLVSAGEYPEKLG